MSKIEPVSVIGGGGRDRGPKEGCQCGQASGQDWPAIREDDSLIEEIVQLLICVLFYWYLILLTVGKFKKYKEIAEMCFSNIKSLFF